MSNELVFTILPFDPEVMPAAKIQLPIDLDDFVRELKEKFPSGEIRDEVDEGGRYIRLYILAPWQEPWVVARYLEDYSQFLVTGRPKSIAKGLIFWYRHYIPMTYPLFLVIPESGYVAELTQNTSLADIENMYPFPVADD